MIWCRFDDAGRPRYGLVEGDVVIPVKGDPFTRFEPISAEPRPLDGVRLLPPVIPGTFFCAGLNYKAHAKRAAGGEYAHAVPTRPEIGYRANSALIGHGEPIVRPAGYGEPLVAEGELVAVIGRKARHCTREEAKDVVFGWTIGNDVSARAWQRTDRTFWRSKNSDTFKPMGPCLVTGADPLSATTTVTVDGTVAASFPTGDMLFDPFDFISAMSRYITLKPGDVVWMGTDETAPIVPGQAVGITIDGLGTLTNPVIEEEIPRLTGSLIPTTSTSRFFRNRRNSWWRARVAGIGGDLPGGGVQRGEQCSGAVPLVVIGAAGSTRRQSSSTWTTWRGPAASSDVADHLVGGGQVLDGLAGIRERAGDVG